MRPLAAVVLTPAFLGTALLAAVFLTLGFLGTAFMAAVFLTLAFLGTAFMAAVFLTLAFLGTAFLATVFLAGMVRLPAADGSLPIESVPILNSHPRLNLVTRPSKSS